MQDRNDNLPEFNITSLAGNVLENVPVGTFIGDFEVLDIDEGSAAQCNFSLSGTNAERLDAPHTCTGYQCGDRIIGVLL